MDVQATSRALSQKNAQTNGGLFKKAPFDVWITRRWGTHLNPLVVVGGPAKPTPDRPKSVRGGTRDGPRLDHKSLQDGSRNNPKVTRRTCSDHCSPHSETSQNTRRHKTPQYINKNQVRPGDSTRLSQEHSRCSSYVGGRETTPSPPSSPCRSGCLLSSLLACADPAGVFPPDRSMVGLRRGTLRTSLSACCEAPYCRAVLSHTAPYCAVPLRTADPYCCILHLLFRIVTPSCSVLLHAALYYSALLHHTAPWCFSVLLHTASCCSVPLRGILCIPWHSWHSVANVALPGILMLFSDIRGYTPLVSHTL